MCSKKFDNILSSYENVISECSKHPVFFCFVLKTFFLVMRALKEHSINNFPEDSVTSRNV